MSSPADALSTLSASGEVAGTLSPSRAGDFLTCPLLYRFRHVDRLPEPTSLDALRGTLVHRVLEVLFDVAADERTPERAAELLRPVWEELRADDPALAEAFTTQGVAEDGWLAACQEVLARYFTLEDPRRLEPAERELYVETVTPSRLLLRGFVDRLDVTPDGLVRVVDYKTGRAPGAGFEAKALFQMKFYALVLWRTRGVVPAMLQLIYLGSGEVIRYRPDEADLLACERKVEAVWSAIETATRTGEWQARKSRLCGWCSHQALCPVYGGTPPPLPTPQASAERPALPVLS
ncbi:RecB family exonuclease [Nocardioides sp. CPCC 205120]|uniref:RecB family exonuclease n=1 Tax=Nocardioides sp. CPCC 205120 TaxID=3406462 RepID=UPI003B5095F4